jgi:hypothetical protein
MLGTDGAQRTELSTPPWRTRGPASRGTRSSAGGGGPARGQCPGYTVTRCYFVLGEQLTAWRRGRATGPR